MTGTFSRADSCRSVTKCFIWGQTFVDVLISLFFLYFYIIIVKILYDEVFSLDSYPGP